ncbi:MAG TPA: class I SAM-dependent methyltransferase [Aestuariivirgaceae bacterium]|jgi:cyclopropane fatty-acyl-phospholipid synthase-like methyltransferase|nr:class I SAM-dependent methyltransferase [Aestuariivirgaceae bacterium]
MKLDVAVGTMDASIRSMKSMRLYDRVERVLKELEAAGFAPDQPLTVQDLSPFDHMHYCGTAAVDHAIADCRIGPGQKVVEIGSGVGGPARWVAATTGAEVTALELQSDLNALAMTLTARTGLGPRVHHLCANILDGPPPGAPFDHALSFLCFLHIPDRSRLFSVIDSSLAPGGSLYIEDFVGLRQLSSAEAAALATKVMCPYVPDRDRYASDLAAAGFTIDKCEDLTALWRDFTASRLQAFRAARPHKEAMLGVDLAAGLEDFYAVMAELFAASAIGGLRIKASRQIGSRQSGSAPHTA